VRIFLGLTEVSGYYRQLKSGFTDLGTECTFIDLSDHRFRYGGTSRIWAAELLKNVIALAGQSRTRRWALRPLNALLRHALLVHVARRCDVFIFGYRSTFFRFRELPILKRLGKRIIYVFHGSDSRPPYLDGYQHRSLSVSELAALTRKKKMAIATIERHADAIVCTPIHAHLHEKPVVVFQMLGVPVRIGDADEAPALPPPPGVTRILHAPSAPMNKGTDRIRGAVSSLVAKGHRIDYVELVERPHAHVVAELKSCHFVVDQLFGEGPIGGLATEAAYFGKPAILGTHTDDAWRMYDPADLPPIVRCDNDSVEAAIERLIDDAEGARLLGARARTFVTTRWTPRCVAANYLRLLDGETDESWWYDPRRLRYAHGAGLSAERVKSFLALYVATCGTDALALRDKPELEREVLALAAGASEC